jgi:hypothetical protein
VVILWHIYNVIFAPEVFPGSKTIFTGKIPRERMRHEHPLEYARMFPEEADEVLGHHADGHAHKDATDSAQKHAAESAPKHADESAPKEDG